MSRSLSVNQSINSNKYEYVISLVHLRNNFFTFHSFVTYSSDSEADSATKQFNGHEIDGQRLKVQIDEKSATSSAPREPQQSSFNAGSSDSKGDQVKILMCPADASEVCFP